MERDEYTPEQRNMYALIDKRGEEELAAVERMMQHPCTWEQIHRQIRVNSAIRAGVISDGIEFDENRYEEVVSRLHLSGVNQLLGRIGY